MSRRRCREAVLQALYQCETLGAMTPEGVSDYFSHFSQAEDTIEHEGIKCESTEYAQILALGVIKELSHLDASIGLAAKNWSVSRMPRVDRNILRVAVYELCFCDDVPARVVLNEAIEIAKEFAGEESPHFINGVLDSIAHGLRNKHAGHSHSD